MNALRLRSPHRVPAPLDPASCPGARGTQRRLPSLVGALRKAGTLVTRVALLLLLGGASLGAQVAAGYDFGMPEDLAPFWTRWMAAKDSGDRQAMDEVAKDESERAEQCLNLLLDDLCQKEVPELHHEVRSLAWSLDAADRSERYITRVRLILDMEMRDRVRRHRAMQQWYQAIDLEEVARKERTFVAWDAALQIYFAAFEEFTDLGDTEQAFYCLSACEQIEYQRERPWERARFLKQVVVVGEQLGFRHPAVDEARRTLEVLLAEGVDPDKDKPAELAEKEDVQPTSGGRDLTSYAEGAEDIVVALSPQAPKKGLPELDLPTFNPGEQYQLWPKTWIAGEGPVPFDTQRATVLNPWGTRWQLSRSGISQFEIDSDADGTPEVSFSPSTTPTRIEVPGPEGEPPYPLMVSILGDRELMFSVETNYAPNADGARLRFWLAGWSEGKALGELWKFFDLNMDGKLGPGVENWDDLVTVYAQEEGVTYWEPDGVHIGKAKRAIPLSSVLPVGSDFYRCTPDANSKQVTLRKLALSTGLLEVDLDLATQPEMLVVREVGKLEGAFFDVLPVRKGAPVVLPAGTYQLCMGQLRSGKRTSMDAVRIYTGTSEPFIVNAGATTKLELGAPFKLTFKTKVDGKERVLDTSTLRVFGRGGEEYAMFYDDPLQPDVSVQDEEGHSVVKAETLRRAGIEQWQTDKTDRQVALWFPIEYRIEVPKGRTYEFKLTQARHPLLGGPFSSDWIR